MAWRGPALKKDWAATTDSFRQFLTWLDEGIDSDGETYLRMRRRLVLYFDRKKCFAPDELADETLSRVARKLQEQGVITDVSPAHYCYIVAKFVFLEHLRRAESRQASFEELTSSSNPRHSPALTGESDTLKDREKLVECLDQCLNTLAEQDRELILEYYQGEGRTKIESRRRLAERLGLSANALTIKACRIRSRVEECVRKRTSET